jgi:Tfp pilus assembly protein PilO
MKLDGTKRKAKIWLQTQFIAINNEQRKRIVSFCYIALTLFTISFFGIFAIAPTLSTISNLNKQYEDNKLVLNALNNKLTALQSLDSQYRNMQDDLTVIYDAIPKSTKIPKLARQIENIAAANNVTVTKLNFGTVEIYPVAKHDPLYSFNFNVTTQGSQNDINSFIASIINFNRIIGIDRVTTGQNEEKTYSVQITGRAYFATE